METVLGASLPKSSQRHKVDFLSLTVSQAWLTVWDYLL